MAELANVILLLTCALAIYVGVRTLAISRHTRQIQEFAIGMNVLSLALGAMVLTLVGALGQSASKDVPLVPHVLGLLLLGAHVVALYVGSWKIFRPADRWPIGVVVILLPLLGVWLFGVLTKAEDPARLSMLYQAVRGIGMGWACWECLRYSRMLRRQVLLGLAEPMMAHRVGLWGFGAAASLVVIVLDLIVLIGSGASLMASVSGLYLTAFTGLLGAGAIALAFFPPSAYVRFIEGPRAESEPA